MADDRRSPALIATIVAIPVVVIVVFIVIAAGRGGSSSDAALPLASATATPSADCTKLVAALPKSFPAHGDRTERDGLIEWPSTSSGADDTGPVQLRCGVPRPPGLAPTAALQVVDPVQWFSSTQDSRGTLWVAVDHRPYVALWLPLNVGNGPISEVSAVIDKILPRASLDLG
ncbi:DUF3515 domain-containing protein [Williamsia deligens]|uniref:DUF3515 domain-containing protein n=1 Tax=Williamsia deligens TaxID=321325 RepID=A0ABW3G5Q3_9NOCA|nr:DUF3515 domain-containing protein [Williamsia deligens]MCP2195083.1 Protein of unknown function (DUF3515) [Williamsia deligens]